MLHTSWFVGLWYTRKMLQPHYFLPVMLLKILKCIRMTVKKCESIRQAVDEMRKKKSTAQNRERTQKAFLEVAKTLKNVESRTEY